MKRSFVCAAWIGMLLTGEAWADGFGPYVSASLGRSEIRDKSGLGGPLVVDKDENDASWSLGVGLRFNRYLALDLGYVDLGRVDGFLALADRSVGSARSSIAAEGKTAALVGMLPIGDFEPYIKAGVLFSKRQWRFDGHFLDYSVTQTTERDSEDPFYGAGLRYPAKQPFQVYLDVTYFDEVGGKTTGSSSYLNTSAGVSWQF